MNALIAERGNLGRALLSVAWAFSGRGLGVVWTAAMLSTLGLGDYGRYSIAYGVGAVVALTLDHPFAVRAVRVDEQSFLRERTSRILVGLGVVVAGLASYAVGLPYPVWFGCVTAGVEILLACVMSSATRAGLPERLAKVSAIRQAASVLCGLVVLLGVHGATIELASLAYLLPGGLVVGRAIPMAMASAPALPGPMSGIVMMSAENFANAVYMQGDVLLLGLLADARSVGVYALAATIGWALAAVGQSYGQTHHESLRASGGDLRDGPSLHMIALLAGAAAVVVLGCAAAMAWFDADIELIEATATMAVFAGLRVVTFVLVVVLYLQAQDRARIVASVVGAGVKIAAIAVLVRWVFPAAAAAPAAAIATVFAELLMCAGLYRVASRRGAGVTT